MLETAPASFRDSAFSQSDSVEALHRTTLDLILFDRLLFKQDVDGARKLVLKGKQNITTTCLDRRKVINGTAHYVIGYGYAAGQGDYSSLESTYVVIEAKKPITLAKGLAQVAAYLGTLKKILLMRLILTMNKAGIQQDRRLARKIVSTVYGIVTDGVAFQFLRLNDDSHLQVSRLYLMIDQGDSKIV